MYICLYRLSLQQKRVPGAFLGGKGGRCVRLTTLPPSCGVVTKSGNHNFLEPSGPVQACNGTALPFHMSVYHRSKNTGYSTDNMKNFIIMQTFIIQAGVSLLLSYIYKNGLVIYVHHSKQVTRNSSALLWRSGSSLQGKGSKDVSDVQQSTQRFVAGDVWLASYGLVAACHFF